MGHAKDDGAVLVKLHGVELAEQKAREEIPRAVGVGGDDTYLNFCREVLAYVQGVRAGREETGQVQPSCEIASGP